MPKAEGVRGLLFLFLSLFCSLTCSAQTYEEWVERGNRAFAVDSLRQAEQAFRQALRIAPDDYRNPLVYANLAKTYEALEQPMKAVDAYDMALGLAPLNVPILRSRANLMLRLGNLNQAAIDYGNIIDVLPDDIDARLCRAFIYQQRKEYLNAQKDYEYVLTLDTDNYTAQLGVAILFQNAGKPAEAITRLSALSSRFPDKAEIYSVRAEIEAELHQPELAIMDLDKALELEPDNRNMLLTRAYIHKSMKNNRLALRDFERAIELGIPRSSLKKELKEVRK